MNMLTIFSRRQSLLTRLQLSSLAGAVMNNIRASLLLIICGSILVAGAIVTALVFVVCNNLIN